MRRDVLTDVLLGTNEVVAVVAAAVGDDDRMLAIRQIQSHVHVCHWLAVLILYLAGEAQVVAVLTWSRAFSIEGQLGRRRRWRRGGPEVQIPVPAVLAVVKLDRSTLEFELLPPPLAVRGIPGANGLRPRNDVLDAVDDENVTLL